LHARYNIGHGRTLVTELVIHPTMKFIKLGYTAVFALVAVALGAVATQMFKEVLSDKLPVDTVSLDSSQIRAGKYLTDKIYVGYTRRFNANPEQGENTNEVRVEYQISPRWTFQSRYGDAQSGGASLVWSKDY
jgi:translocation and assembly module TamB